MGGPVRAVQPLRSNHSVAPPRGAFIDAGECRGCFEMPRQPGATDLWPGPSSLRWGVLQGVGQPLEGAGEQQL